MDMLFQPLEGMMFEVFHFMPKLKKITAICMSPNKWRCSSTHLDGYRAFHTPKMNQKNSTATNRWPHRAVHPSHPEPCALKVLLRRLQQAQAVPRQAAAVQRLAIERLHLRRIDGSTDAKPPENSLNTSHPFSQQKSLCEVFVKCLARVQGVVSRCGEKTHHNCLFARVTTSNRCRLDLKKKKKQRHTSQPKTKVASCFKSAKGWGRLAMRI